MDWSKAKTILIVCFVIINIILFYYIYTTKDDTNLIVEDKLINESIKLLDNKNINIEANIPKEIPGLKSLIVEFENRSIKGLDIKFFRGRANIYKTDNNEEILEYDNEKIIYKKNNMLTYINENISDLESKKVEKEEALKISNDFLTQKGFNLDDMKNVYTKEINNKCEVYYSKVFKDRFVENAYTKVVVSSQGVEYLERVWLNVLKEGELPIHMESAPKAILELLGNPKAYNSTILSIDLCYFFDLEEDTNLSENINVKKGKAMPTWRVLLDDGTIIVLDNN